MLKKLPDHFKFNMSLYRRIPHPPPVHMSSSSIPLHLPHHGCVGLQGNVVAYPGGPFLDITNFRCSDQYILLPIQLADF